MRAPRSTYRLQLHRDFGFGDAAKVAGYLARLGVSELYVSPIMKAAPGSTHGYDVLDQRLLNPELGGEAGFQELQAALRAHGLGLTVDFVPNHMGVGCDGNPYWDDVLQHGQASAFAHYFDIDWHSPKGALTGKLLLPILPDQYGLSLERGDLKLAWDGATLRVCVGERKLPLRPHSLAGVLVKAADLSEETSSELARGLREVAARSRALVEETDEAGRSAYLAAAHAVTKELAEVLQREIEAAAFQSALEQLSGTAGIPDSFDVLDELLRAQFYRLSSWRLGLEAINYRRFFAVNELAGIRVELPQVFDAAHAQLFRLVESGAVTAVRLDHIDGLYDPVAYLEQLDAALRRATRCEPQAAPLHVTVEKILAPDEHLPQAFVAHGTTGYEFIRVSNGVFVDRRAELNLTSTYRRFTGDQLSFEGHLLQAKRDILGSLLASDASRLSRELEALAEQDRRSRDLTWQSLHEALIEIMAAFETYRSYVRPSGERAAEDEAVINRAVAQAIARNPTAGRGAYQFIRSLLLHPSERVGAAAFAMRFQQCTGPVMAKSVEDTAFYRYTRFVAENEVGGHPDRVGVDLAEFHSQNALRAQRAPLSLLASSTHDTKRGEDVRARLAVLSELPNTWRRLVHELSRSVEGLRGSIEGQHAPTRPDEYLYYQTLIGAMPFAAKPEDIAGLEERLQAYMLKACREAKSNTSWLHPNEEYEAAVQAFITGSLREPGFVERARRFGARIDSYGACNALAQVALKLCSPGVPDTYQGSELWHQMLVDPDNRRPVDYEQLRSRLQALDESPLDGVPLAKSLLERFEDSSIKLFVIRTLLKLRNERPELFEASYMPLDAGGHCIAFARGSQLLCAVPRFSFRLTRGRARWPLGACWGDQRLHAPEASGSYRNLFTGQQIAIRDGVDLAQVFEQFPVAVLVR